MSPYDDFLRIRDEPWSLPELVNRDFIMALPSEGLRLSRILPLLAGIDVAPRATDREVFVQAAHLVRAFDALAEAAFNGVVILRGARGNAPAQDIPCSVFADPLTLVGSDDDAFGPDDDRWPWSNPDNWHGDLQKYNEKVWRRVTVERDSLARWVRKAFAKQPNANRVDAAKEWLLSAYPVRSERKVHELLWEFRQATGKICSLRTFESAIALAYPQSAKVRNADNCGRPAGKSE